MGSTAREKDPKEIKRKVTMKEINRDVRFHIDMAIAMCFEHNQIPNKTATTER